MAPMDDNVKPTQAPWPQRRFKSLSLVSGSSPYEDTALNRHTMTSTNPLATDLLVFIGGGNMASAILGGLLRQGHPPQQVLVVDPDAAIRQSLLQRMGVNVLAAPDATLTSATQVIWAVKPQHFKTAAAQARPFTAGALHLSVAAGIRTDSLTQWLGSERIVRAMPNMPALVGLGQTGLFARSAVTPADRLWVQQVLGSTGACMWLAQESQLDAVTALSGSGPAYVFYFMEAMARAGQSLGLSAEQSQQLAIGTFVGASELARASTEPPAVLRERVTSKGGTTHAALSAMAHDQVAQAFERAMQAACARAKTLGDEFGR
jgi:pyrroline-5-carboxylate reductase